MVKQRERTRIWQSGKIAPSIAPSRACVCFENKIFYWPPVSFSDHWPIRMLGLLPLFALNYLFSALFYEKTALLLTNQNGEMFSCILSAQEYGFYGKSQSTHKIIKPFEGASHLPEICPPLHSSIPVLSLSSPPPPSALSPGASPFSITR